jgi:hypothetical protein
MSVDVEISAKCPFCNESILKDAKKCKHCGEWLDPVLRAKNERLRSAPRAIAANSTRVTVHGRRINHFLHIVLCFATLGAWLPIYILVLIFG